jgi:Ca2+-transporting ATPase
MLVFHVRSETKHLLSQGWEAFTSNPSLLLAVLASLALQLAAIYFPPLSGVLKMAPLTLDQLGLAALTSGATFLVVPRLLIKKPKEWIA